MACQRLPVSARKRKGGALSNKGVELRLSFNMNRQNIIFASLLVIVAAAIVVAGYVNGTGPLAVLSNGISRLTSGGQMVPAGRITEEKKAPTAPDLKSGLWINS